MSDLTANISRSEMACPCCEHPKFDVADYELLTVAQDSAEFFKHRYSADRVAVSVLSGNRCKTHNRTVGGADESQHIDAKALDYRLKVYVDGAWRFISSHELSEYLDSKYPGKYGIGLYPRGRVHLDCRPSRARWRG